MGQNLPPLRAICVMLCIALAVVLAGAASASVVDRVYHEVQRHDHLLGLTFSIQDHDADHHDAGEPSDEAQGAGDRPAGMGHHHHVDPPAGALPAFGFYDHVALSAPVPELLMEAAPVKSVRPGGLDRPPRRITNLA